MKTLPPALAKAISEKRLVIFCGAGVSMISPSNLPSWWGFNQSILDEAKQCIFDGFPDLAEEVKERIRSFSLDEIPVESFSDTLVSTFAGSGYFPILEILDSTQPNSVHKAFAELGKTRTVHTFITTNFDTLIEQSFREIAVSLNVFIEEEDFRRPAPASYSCELIKLHGSVKSTSTLIDTVRQKLRGIPLETRSRLANLFSKYHVLVLGYSGTDLVFGEDYLAFSSINENCPGISWLVRPGTSPSELVRKTVDRAGTKGAIISGELPDFLENLGVSIDNSSYAPRETPPTEDERARNRIREFFKQDYVGKFSCAAFCVRLMWMIGDHGTADAICSMLAVHPELTSAEAPIEAVIAFGTLANWAMKKFDFPQAMHWLKRDLGALAGIKQMYADHKLEVSPEVALEWNRNLGGAYNNLGLCLTHMNEPEKARAAFNTARSYAEKAQDYACLSLIYSNLALLEEENEDTDHVLHLLRIARALAKDAGMAQTTFEANVREAKVLMSIAEYDEAYARLRQAEDYISFSGGIESRLELNLTLADLALRRGDMDRSYEIFREAAKLAEAGGSQTIADRIRLRFCVLLSFHKPFRREIKKELTTLLDRYRDTDSDVIKPEAIEKLLKLIRDKKNPLRNPSINFAFDGRDDNESNARHNLASAEFRKELSSLPDYFEWLWRQKYGEGQPDRLLNIANAFLIASERAGDTANRAMALNYLGISRDMLGDSAGALEAYNLALDIEGTSTEIRRTIKLHSAMSRSKLNDAAGAKTILDELIAAYREEGDIENVLRSMQTLAHHFARHARLEDAITELEAALPYCDPASDGRLKEIISRQVNVWKQRLNPPERTALPDERKIVLGGLGNSIQLDIEQLKDMRANAKSPQELSDLGGMAAEAGFMAEARSIAEQALALFKEAREPKGIAGCFINLGAIARAEGNIEQALEYTAQGLSIYQRFEDIEMQIVALANIASYHLADHQDNKAKECSHMCLKLAEGHKPSRHMAVAWHVLGVVSLQENKIEESLRAARGFIETYNRIQAPDMEAIFDMYSEIVSVIAPAPAAGHETSPSELEEIGMEATRLKILGDYEGALKLLEDFSPRCESTEDSARIAAEIGNVLQMAERHSEAIAAYQKASELFRQCDLPDRVARLEIDKSVSMRKSGDLPGAASTLRDLLQYVPSGPGRAQALIALCNTLMALALSHKDPDDLTTGYLDEASALFDEARAIDGLDSETLGSIETNASTLSILKDDLAGALEKLKKAEQHYLRCNSQYLKTVEEQIDRVRAELANIENSGKG